MQMRKEDNRMSVYVIAQGKIENRGLLDQYVAKVIPTIESHQGRIVAFDEEPEVVEGPIEHPRTVILEFPSMTAFHAWYGSPKYQEILPLRLKSTRGTLIVAKGSGSRRFPWRRRWSQPLAIAMTRLQHAYEVRPRKDHRGVNLISDALPFGRLWYGEPNAASNAVDYAKFRSRSHDAVIRVYDEAGNVIEPHEHAGDFKEW
jgi:uncharacterized protein (DUF1330 family)